MTSFSSRHDPELGNYSPKPGWIARYQANLLIFYEKVLEGGEDKWCFFDLDANVPRKFTTDRLPSQIRPLDDAVLQRQALERFKQIPRGQLRFRLTHCFGCKEPLDSRASEQCSDCGWIICTSCRACGCQYRTPAVPTPR